MSSSTFAAGRRTRTGGFMLLEIILAVLLLTIGVLSLGRCMKNCLGTQEILNQERRARLALENAMVEIQASPALPDEKKQTPLDGMFRGLTLLEQRKTLALTNENNVTLSDLHQITLTVSWTSSDGTPHANSVAFDLLRGRG